jgi:1-acyl-sn-glycerol-3-phosphate acyltransferase
LSGGAGILLFPEGTRSADGQVKAARAGIGMTVIKSSAPVIPVRIFGAFEAWGRHQKFPRPHRIRIVFGPPLHFEKLRAEAETCDKARLKEIYQEIADQLMDAIRGLKQD